MTRIPFAVVGLHFGTALIREHLAATPGGEEFELRLVCDRDVGLARRVGDECGVECCGSLEQVLAREDIEVVGLFTPPEGRAALVEQVVEAGKHVVSTKPFETCTDRAAAALRRARGLGRHVLLNTPPPCPSAEQGQIASWRSDHELGELVSAQAETWAAYRETPDGSWYDDPERCPLAPIPRLGIYGLHELLAVGGAPEAVVGLGSRRFTRRPTADDALLGLRFRSGALATLRAHFGTDDGVRYPDDLVLQFERGTVRRVDLQSVGRPHARALRLTTAAGAGARTEEKVFERPPVHGAYPWGEFAKILRGELKATLDLRQILYGVQVVEALPALERGEGLVSLRPVEELS